MKNFVAFLSFFVLMIAVMPTQAQTTKQVGDPTSYMTPDQLAKYHSDIKVAELEKKLQTYGNWVGVGGEVGIAVKEGLSAVVDVADQFGKTDVGKFTLVMVAWKVMGKDVIRIILGLVFLVIITWLFVKVYKNTYVPKRMMVENPGFMKYPKKYEIIKPDSSWDGYQAVKILLLFLYAGAIGISYAIMFAQ